MSEITLYPHLRMVLDVAIADRVRKLNPYYSGSLTDVDEKTVDKLIVDAAWQITHPKKKKR